MARVLVTGVTGQLGFFVADLLAKRGDQVWGLVRQSTLGRRNVGDDNLPYRPITGDLLDEYSLLSILEEVQPDRIFNFGAQSFVPASWTQPILTAQYTGLGVVRLLEAIRHVTPHCRLLQAGSSELFAEADRSPQDESTPIRPINPYGIAKAASISLVTNYRESYGLFACSGILFNHESPLRPARFVTRKITSAAWRIGQGSRERLALGNLGVYRDWGWVPDYVEAMWAILQCDTADDFVIASGVSHSLEEFVAAAFAEVGLDWRDHVDLDGSLKRPNDIAYSAGDPAKARRVLGWSARTSFAEIVSLMVRAERVGPAAVS